MEDSLAERFDSRYDDAFHWIKTKILAESKKGILNLIFWRLPLIFIEGKVVAAFFHPQYKNPDKGPLLDTIRIPESKKIFNYETFIESFQGAVDNETFTQWKEGRNNKSATYCVKRKMAVPDDPFDFLDYFGIPCKTENAGTASSGKYDCAYFTFNCFAGRMEIWVVASSNTKGFLEKYEHQEELKKFFEKIEEIQIYESGEITRELLEGHVLKHEIMPSVFKDGKNKSDLSENKIALSEYLVSAFSVLHESLLDSLKWEDDPCRLFILVNSRLFNPKLRFFLTEAQKNYYRDRAKCSKYRGVADNKNDELRRAEKATKCEIILQNNEGDDSCEEFVDAACKIMEDSEQSGTVSSLIKQRGFYELFLEKTTFKKHPILFKEAAVKRDWEDEYLFPEDLKEIEPFFLLTLPNVQENNLRPNVHGGNTKYQFAMIPYFFRGHPFGCIAFFNPKLRSKEKWYGYLTKVLNILDEREETIYQAAIKDLCQNIFEMVEGFENE